MKKSVAELAELAEHGVPTLAAEDCLKNGVISAI